MVGAMLEKLGGELRKGHVSKQASPLSPPCPYPSFPLCCLLRSPMQPNRSRELCKATPEQDPASLYLCLDHRHASIWRRLPTAECYLTSLVRHPAPTPFCPSSLRALALPSHRPCHPPLASTALHPPPPTRPFCPLHRWSVWL